MLNVVKGSKPCLHWQKNFRLVIGIYRDFTLHRRTYIKCRPALNSVKTKHLQQQRKLHLSVRFFNSSFKTFSCTSVQQ